MNRYLHPPSSSFVWLFFSSSRFQSKIHVLIGLVQKTNSRTLIVKPLDSSSQTLLLRLSQTSTTANWLLRLPPPLFATITFVVFSMLLRNPRSWMEEEEPVLFNGGSRDAKAGSVGSCGRHVFLCYKSHETRAAAIPSLDSFAFFDPPLAQRNLRVGFKIESSVSSFFFCRVDTLIDKMLEQIGTPEALDLRGKVAVAQAALAYKLYQKRFSGPRWETLVKKGAKKQRLLWASTSVKNPAYSDTLYVAPLIGPDIVEVVSLSSYEEKEWCKGSESTV